MGEGPYQLPGALWSWIEPVLEDDELGDLARECADGSPPADVGGLVARLKQNPDPRLTALVLLKLSTVGHPKISQVLTRFRSHGRSEVRWAAVESLARMPVPEALEALLPALEDPEPPVREAAMAALRGREKKPVEELLSGLLGSSDVKQRELGARVLASTRWEGYESRLVLLLKDSNVQVQRLALELVREHGTEDCVELLDDISVEFEGSPLEPEVDRTIEILRARGQGGSPGGSATGPGGEGAAATPDDGEEEDPFLAIERMKRSIAEQQQKILEEKSKEEAVFPEPPEASLEEPLELAMPAAGRGSVDAFDSSHDFALEDAGPPAGATSGDPLDALADADAIAEGRAPSGPQALDGESLGEDPGLSTVPPGTPPGEAPAPVATAPLGDAAPLGESGLDALGEPGLDALGEPGLDALDALAAPPPAPAGEGAGAAPATPDAEGAPDLAALVDAVSSSAPATPNAAEEPATAPVAGDALDALGEPDADALAALAGLPPGAPEAPEDPAPLTEEPTLATDPAASVSGPGELPGLELTEPLETPPAETPEPTPEAPAPVEEELDLGFGDDSSSDLGVAEPISLAESPSGSSRPRSSREWIAELLRELIQRGGSDLHLQADSTPRMRIDGQLVDSGDEEVEQGALTKAMSGVAGERYADFIEAGDLDFAYSLRDVGRFRCSYYLQARQPAAVFRVVPGKIPSVRDLGLPGVVLELLERPAGLLLLAGPGASGKSTTLAAMVDLLNETRGGHILTIEDPVEFLHSDRSGSVTQREVGSDCRSIEDALVAAERQDVDVLVVGDLARPGALQLAIDHAGAGRLVLGALSAPTTEQTLETIASLHPQEERPRVRGALAAVLLGIVSQALLPRQGGGRVAAFEVLVSNQEAADRIARVGGTGIRRIIQGAPKLGMMTLEQSLARLVRAGQTSQEEAMLRAAQPAELLSLIQAPKGES